MQQLESMVRRSECLLLTKDNGRYIVKALDPLAPLVTLTANVEHMKVDLFDGESRLEDALREDSTPEHVLTAGRVVGLADIVNLVEEVLGAVYELVLVAPVVALLNARILPQPRHMREEDIVVLLLVLFVHTIVKRGLRFGVM